MTHQQPKFYKVIARAMPKDAPKDCTECQMEHTSGTYEADSLAELSDILDNYFRDNYDFYSIYQIEPIYDPVVLKQ